LAVVKFTYYFSLMSVRLNILRMK